MRIDATNSFIPTTGPSFLEQGTKTETSFGSWLGEKVIQTNEELKAADKALVQLASGEAESLHSTMLTLEQAKLSFQYLEQIRNRLMSAYQELLREQI